MAVSTNLTRMAWHGCQAVAVDFAFSVVWSDAVFILIRYTTYPVRHCSVDKLITINYDVIVPARTPQKTCNFIAHVS